MEDLSPQMKAGKKLKQLIKDSYPSQEAFANDFCADLRTINRYINEGINKVDVLQALAAFFQIDITDFFKNG